MDHFGSKFSSCFIPPEAVHVDRETGVASVKSARGKEALGQGQGQGLAYNLLPLDSSFDVWSLGCLLYQMCHPEVRPLFQGSNDDNISTDPSDADNLKLLAEWSEDVKMKKLSKISDTKARNLIAQMLSKDAQCRPSISRILAHPFLSGNSKAVRMVGQEASFDVFISYRVASDLAHAEKLVQLLTAGGLRVWWDKLCLKPGEDWEEGFCAGLVDSRAFVCIISRDSINHATNMRQNFSTLSRDSSCDNVLLEYRLALELRELRLIDQIMPVLVGDQISPGYYGKYFERACSPRAVAMHVNR